MKKGVQENQNMIAQLVYIHIEKSAGTSQRRLLINIYGRDDVFWENIDSVIDRSRDISRQVIGGHLPYIDFKNTKRCQLFTAVVRHPVSRAVSLFNYHVWGGDEGNRKRWRWLGLDQSSMLRTIKQLPRFRRSISNQQCMTLSGHKSFDAVEEVLHNENFILGVYDKLEEFNARLAQMLSWENRPLPRANVAQRSDYYERILTEPGLEEELLKLNQEDLKLYEFISQHGVYQNTPDEAIFREHLSARMSGRVEILDRADVRRLSIKPAGSDSVALKGEQAHVLLRITNNGSRALACEGERAIMVGYTWLARSGEVLQPEGARTPLPRNLLQGESCTVQASLQRPPSVEPGIYQVQFSLLQFRVRWLKTLDLSHTLTLNVVVEPWNLENSKLG